MKRHLVSIVLSSVAVILALGSLSLLIGCGEMQACPMHSSGMMSCHKAPPSSAGPVAAAPSTVAVANSRCPIMGGAINSASVPASLVREYKGQKVGFCCGGCPANWDKLSDAEKDAKLAKVATASK